MTPKIGDTLNSDLSISLLGGYDSIDIVIVPEELNSTAVNGIASGGSISSIDNTVDCRCAALNKQHTAHSADTVLDIMIDNGDLGNVGLAAAGIKIYAVAGLRTGLKTGSSLINGELILEGVSMTGIISLTEGQSGVLRSRAVAPEAPVVALTGSKSAGIVNAVCKSNDLIECGSVCNSYLSGKFAAVYRDLELGRSGSVFCEVRAHVGLTAADGLPCLNITYNAGGRVVERLNQEVDAFAGYNTCIYRSTGKSDVQIRGSVNSHRALCIEVNITIIIEEVICHTLNCMRDRCIVCLILNAVKLGCVLSYGRRSVNILLGAECKRAAYGACPSPVTDNSMILSVKRTEVDAVLSSGSSGIKLHPCLNDICTLYGICGVRNFAAVITDLSSGSYRRKVATACGAVRVAELERTLHRLDYNSACLYLLLALFEEGESSAVGPRRISGSFKLRISRDLCCHIEVAAIPKVISGTL